MNADGTFESDPVKAGTGGRCVCGHGKFLHRKGVCFATVNPCGCQQFQADNGIEPAGGTVPQDKYDGFYAGKKWSA